MSHPQPKKESEKKSEKRTILINLMRLMKWAGYSLEDSITFYGIMNILNTSTEAEIESIISLVPPDDKTAPSEDQEEEEDDEDEEEDIEVDK